MPYYQWQYNMGRGGQPSGPQAAQGPQTGQSADTQPQGPMLPGSFSPQFQMWNRQNDFNSAQENVRRLQEQCARGDGSACIQAQMAEQRLGDMQGQMMGKVQNQQIGMMSGPGSRNSMMGVGRGSGGGFDPSGMMSAMLGNTFGGAGGWSGFRGMG